MLTEEQLRLVEDNINLPKQICYKMLTESKIRNDADLYEDCIATANVSLCQAAQSYNKKKGEFHVFATVKIKWDVWTYLQTEYSKGMISAKSHNVKKDNMPTQFIDVESLRDTVQRNKQIIPDQFKITKDDTMVVDSMLDLIKVTNAAEQTLLSLILDGYSDEEIVEILDTSMKYLSKLKASLKSKMIDIFKNCA